MRHFDVPQLLYSIRTLLLQGVSLKVEEVDHCSEIIGPEQQFGLGCGQEQIIGLFFVIILELNQYSKYYFYLSLTFESYI